jgi:hypothetical protein
MSSEFSHLVGESVPVYGRTRFRAGEVIATRGRDAVVRLNNGDTILAKVVQLKHSKKEKWITLLTESDIVVPDVSIYQQVNIPVSFIQRYCSIRLRSCPDEEPSPSW